MERLGEGGSQAGEGGFLAEEERVHCQQRQERPWDRRDRRCCLKAPGESWDPWKRWEGPP